jgi:type VI secretion system protein ImpA
MPALLDDLDLDAILRPITGGTAVGTDPRSDVSPQSLYFQIRDARAEARAMERQAESSGAEDPAAPARWRIVRSLSVKALSEHAKDLELATWLTEALVRAAGLRGLTAGAMIVHGLLERFWDDIYPLPDEDGVATRVGPLAGLSGQGADGTLMQPLRKITLFHRHNGEAFGYWQYQLSDQLATITDPERRQQRLDAGVIAFDEVEKDARQVPASYWVGLRDEIGAALGAWNAMTVVLDERAGEASPSMIRVKHLLADMLATTERFAPAADAMGSSDAETSSVAGNAAGAATAGNASGAAFSPPSGGPMVSRGGVSGREDALRQLGEIAAWFKTNEPNSPLAYTLEEAVRRGRMSWPDLVAELLPDMTSRNGLLVSLGIRPDSE